MKVNVKIAGASYNGVPAVLLPLQDGGNATFCEVSDTTASASDVVNGKKFYNSKGVLTTGTAANVFADGYRVITDSEIDAMFK